MRPRAWLGLTFLILASTALVLGVAAAPGSGTLGPKLLDHLRGDLRPLSVRFRRPPALEAGDPVYVLAGEAFALVGRVQGPRAQDPGLLDLHVDPFVLRRYGRRTRAVAMTPDSNLVWVLRILVPPEMRRRVLAGLRDLWIARRAELLVRLRGPLLELGREVAGLLADSLPEILRRHRKDLDELERLLREEVYPQEVRPVVEEVWLPLLEDRLEDTVGEVGWEIASRIRWTDIAAVVWRTLLDGVGLGDEAEARKRLADVLRAAAVPVLQEKAPEIASRTFEATKETLDRPEVRAALERAAPRVVRHPAFRRFMRRVLRDWLVENPALEARLRESMKDPRLAAPIQQLWEEAEPLLEDWLEEILAREDRKGMDHQLVRVLRRVVLGKDARYLLLEPAGGVPLGDGGMVLPGRIGRDP